jgi:hypothetical protein
MSTPTARRGRRAATLSLIIVGGELDFFAWPATVRRIREISAMKWNTPDWLFGLLAGVLFGLFIAMTCLERVFDSLEASSGTRSLIGIFGFVGYLIVLLVRHWWRQKNTPASIES